MVVQSLSASVAVDQARLEAERKSRLFNILAGSGVIACIVFLSIMLYSSMSPWSYISIFGFLLLVGLASLALNRKDHFLLASLLYLFGVSISIFGIILIGTLRNQYIGSVIYYFPFTVLAAGMLLGSRSTFGFATLGLLLILVVGAVAGSVTSFERETFFSTVISISLPAAVLCYLMALVAWLYGSSLERALQSLTDRSQQLETANQEISAFSQTLEAKVEERTHELQEFVSMVAHDLRVPLTVVRGYTEMFQSRQPAARDEKEQRALDAIESNVQHMLHLTDDLLEISRLQSGGIEFAMQALTVDDVIQLVCERFERQLVEKGLGLKLNVPPELPRVWGDHFRLTQVLSNLIGNAYDYTPSGAIIVDARPANGFVEISVADTGVGIPPHEQARLFTHFFRGEHSVVRRQKGAGLGLTIARSIVEAHGGEIWAESEPGKGSTFHFTVPVAPDEDSDPPILDHSQTK
jgi:signal transduction histidine kinase